MPRTQTSCESCLNAKLVTHTQAFSEIFGRALKNQCEKDKGKGHITLSKFQRKVVPGLTEGTVSAVFVLYLLSLSFPYSSHEGNNSDGK